LLQDAATDPKLVRIEVNPGWGKHAPHVVYRVNNCGLGSKDYLKRILPLSRTSHFKRRKHRLQVWPGALLISMAKTNQNSGPFVRLYATKAKSAMAHTGS
jgi:hypothetical protein